MKYLCIDIGGSRIKVAVLDDNKVPNESLKVKPYNISSLGWINQSLSSLVSDEWYGIPQKLNIKGTYDAIAICVATKITDGAMTGHWRNRGVDTDLKSKFEKVSNFPDVYLINDGEAWMRGFIKVLDSSLIKFPVLCICLGTGIGVCYKKSLSQIETFEISELGKKEWPELKKVSRNNFIDSWKVHDIIGKRFFDWTDKEEHNWNYEKIRSEFTIRVAAFLKDLEAMKPFETVLIGGGNSEYVSLRNLKLSLNKSIIAPDNSIPHPDIIPLIGLLPSY